MLVVSSQGFQLLATKVESNCPVHTEIGWYSLIYLQSSYNQNFLWVMLVVSSQGFQLVTTKVESNCPVHTDIDWYSLAGL
jgi:hypothetical protein